MNSEETRKVAEAEYALVAFDYARGPIGSRDWAIFKQGFDAAMALRDARPVVPGDVAKDAARYRWHRAHGGSTWTNRVTSSRATGELYDAATDLAMIAAGQCAEATSDESGTPRCKRIAELEAKIGRLSDGSVPDDATMALHLGGQMSWQPIETAPQDETQFLGWNGSRMDRTWVGWHDGTGPVYVYADYVSWKPTHWMSLPEPPK